MWTQIIDWVGWLLMTFLICMTVESAVINLARAWCRKWPNE